MVLVVVAVDLRWGNEIKLRKQKLCSFLGFVLKIFIKETRSLAEILCIFNHSV